VPADQLGAIAEKGPAISLNATHTEDVIASLTIPKDFLTESLYARLIIPGYVLADAGAGQSLGLVLKSGATTRVSVELPLPAAAPEEYNLIIEAFLFAVSSTEMNFNIEVRATDTTGQCFVYTVPGAAPVSIPGSVTTYTVTAIYNNPTANSTFHTIGHVARLFPPAS
jgi:hypothetical protein